MPTRSASYFCILLLSFFCACKQNGVVLDDTNASGEVPQLGNLYFRFNKALYPDSLLNNWDSSAYLSFEPSIPGRFRWEGPEELVFSPSQPLAPATAYKVKFNDELFRFSHYDNVSGDAPTFHTAALQLIDAQTVWTMDGGSNLPKPQINLQFNYPVKAEAIKEKTGPGS